MSRRFSFAILAVVSALAAVDSISPAAAAQDQYCLQGRRWGYPGKIASFPATTNAWRPRAAPSTIAGSTPNTRSRASDAVVSIGIGTERLNQRVALDDLAIEGCA